MNYVLRVTKAIIAPGLHTGLVNIPLLCGILEATRSRKRKICVLILAMYTFHYKPKETFREKVTKNGKVMNKMEY